MGDFAIRVGHPARRTGEDLLDRVVLIDVEYLPVISWDVATPVLAVRLRPESFCGHLLCTIDL